MFSPGVIIGAILLYFGVLFFIANWVAKKSSQGKSPADNPVVYSLALAVYCTAWTYFGSVGLVATSGTLFLSIYLGPTLAVILWWTVLRKLVRIKDEYRITSIADFVAARYGKSQRVAGLVTVMALVGIAPYIALQLKAITETFSLLTDRMGDSVAGEGLGVFIVCLMILFTIIFGVRRLAPTERHQGMIMAVAVQSGVKLATFLAVGVVVTFFVYDGFGDIFQRIQESPFATQFSENGSGTPTATMWTTYLVLGMSAILFLPRQFHIGVVENSSEKHIRTAMWLFPAYMLAINIFVIPIAFGGLLNGLPVERADTFVLDIPLQLNKPWLAMVVFLGGFSAAASMIMISSMTMSTMLTNHIMLPAVDRLRILQFLRHHVLHARWMGVATVILVGYFFERVLSGSYTLVNMGIISFTAALQFAPAILGGLFWRTGNKHGAFWGMSAGFAMWFYTLLLPSLVRSGWLAQELLTEGPFGIGLLRPEQLLGLTGLEPLSHAVFWTVVCNVGVYTLVSMFSDRDEEEERQAEVFVGILHQGTVLSPSKAEGTRIHLKHKVQDALALLGEYFDTATAAKMIDSCLFNTGLREMDEVSVLELSEFLGEVEKQLAGSVGTTVAHKALRDSAIVSRAETEQLSRVYGKILADLKVSPDELKQRVDYYREKRAMVTLHASELKSKIAELKKTVAQRERAQDALQKSEEQFRLLVETMNDGIIVVDRDARLTYANPRMCSMLGIQSDEIIGRPVRAFFDGPNLPLVEEQLSRRKRGERMPYEIEWTPRSGDKIVTIVSPQPILDENGVYAGSFSVVTDITERKRSEEARRQSEEILKGTLNSTGDGILVVDKHQRILTSNIRFAEIWGIPEDLAASVDDESMLEFVSAQVTDPVAFKKRVYEIYASSGQRIDEIRLKDNRVIERFTCPLLRDNMQVGRVWNFHDITERRSLQEQFYHSQKMETVGRLAAGIAHDFNNMLAPILCYSEMIQTDLMPEDPRYDQVEQILKAAERSKDLTQRLLAFSRKQVLELKPVALQKLVAGFQKMLRGTIREDIQIDCRAEQDVWHIQGDVSQIEQVLLNLAVNAQHAMPTSGTLTIEIDNAVLDDSHLSLHPDARAGDHVRLSIRDTGFGMDEETRKHIFEPFFTTKERGKGTGLGLATVYGIVSQHGGHIVVRSEVGAGTTFDVYFPRYEGAIEASRPKVREKQNANCTETVLVAEDDDIMRNLIVTILNQQGYKVLPAANGHECLDLARTHDGPIGLLLTDVIMPEMNGKQLRNALEKTIPDLKVIFMSGYTDDVIAEHGVLEPDICFIQKPFKVNALVHKVRETLDERSEPAR